MNLVQITPGAGGMYCGNCFRDNALVAAFRKAGHEALMIPLYLPLKLEEEDHSRGTPLFFSGINVYLEEKLPWFRRAPGWLLRGLASPWLLRQVARWASTTHPSELGALTLSMVRGEAGHQARELETLLEWLGRRERPDLICLSNGLLLGLARGMKDRLGCPVACMLQGEDSFLDALVEPYRSQAWSELAARAREVDLLVAPSGYYARVMTERLGLKADHVQVVPNGINLEGFTPEPGAGARLVGGEDPVLGYFARMCVEKGLETLVEAFIRLHEHGRVPRLRLKIGGGCGPGDEPLVRRLRDRLRGAGLTGRVEWHPNLSRAEKVAFLRSLTLFSVPAVYGEAFGLYVLEALASGVPVVQPNHASFPELVEATGGGVIYDPHEAGGLADAVERLLQQPAQIRELGAAGRRTVFSQFGVEHMMESMLKTFRECVESRAGS